MIRPPGPHWWHTCTGRQPFLQDSSLKCWNCSSVQDDDHMQWTHLGSGHNVFLLVCLCCPLQAWRDWWGIEAWPREGQVLLIGGWQLFNVWSLLVLLSVWFCVFATFYLKIWNKAILCSTFLISFFCCSKPVSINLQKYSQSAVLAVFSTRLHGFHQQWTICFSATW